MRKHRSIDALVEEQVRRWALARRNPEAAQKDGPVIAISRLTGCNGSLLAQQLAHRMGWELFDQQLLAKVAESSHLSEAILKTVDERNQPAVREWFQSLFLQRYPSSDYSRHLAKVLMAIAEHGRAVILGRGASFILKSQDRLSVLLVAPLEERLRNFAYQEGLPQADARRRLFQADSERRAFIQRHFHADILDPTQYDLVLNTAAVSADGALAVIEEAWRQKKMPAAASSPSLPVF
jgi:cytidylate kinase